MKKIDISSWERKDIYAFYKDMDMPRYQMTFEIDVYWFYKYVKTNELSFYYSMMWLILKAMNQIENFRYRLKGDEVYLYDQIHPSFTDKIDQGETFKIVTTDYDKDLFKFNQVAKQKSDAQGKTFINIDEEQRDDLVYITSFPWATYTHASNVYQLDAKDAIPRVGWGRYKKERG